MSYGPSAPGLQFDDPRELADEMRKHAYDSLDLAEVAWMCVYEQRPEVTQRRDQGTPTSWLQGQRVLLIGCEAIGEDSLEICSPAESNSSECSSPTTAPS